MAYTQADLDNINAAIAGGELRVTIADRTVVYRSISELMQVRSLIQDDLAAAAGNKRRRIVRLNVDKGIR